MPHRFTSAPPVSAVTAIRGVLHAPRLARHPAVGRHQARATSCPALAAFCATTDQKRWRRLTSREGVEAEYHRMGKAGNGEGTSVAPGQQAVREGRMARSRGIERT